MTEDEVFEAYGEVPLYFSHYYNFLFVYKSAKLEDGHQIFVQLGGTMEKVSAMVVDVEDPITLEEISDDDKATIKNAKNEVVWQQGKET